MFVKKIRNFHNFPSKFVTKHIKFAWNFVTERPPFLCKISLLTPRCIKSIFFFNTYLFNTSVHTTTAREKKIYILPFLFSAAVSMTKAMHDVDTGYSWLILIADNILVFLCEGLRKSLSVLLPTLKDQFETHTWLIGIMIALTHGIKDFLGRSYN